MVTLVRVVIVALLLLTIGCNDAGDRIAGGRVRIRYWEKWTGFEADAMQAVVEAYNASQNDVYVEYLSTSQIDRKLLLATSGGNPPDVAGLWSHLLPMYVDKGALLPLDRYMKQDAITPDHYLPSIHRLCTYRGFTWGLPSTPATVALHYNKRLFREAGLDPERPPQTLDELDACAERLTMKNANGAIEQLGFTPSDPGWWNSVWCHWFGGSLLRDGRPTATDPACVEAYRWVQTYPERYGSGALQAFQAASAGQFASAQNPFIAGKLAMQIQGVWMSNFIEKYNPDLEWGVAPFPSADPQLTAVTLVECDMLVLPRGCPHPVEAWNFIRYVQQQQPMETLCLAHKKFSPLRTVSVDFNKRHSNPYIGVFRRLAESDHARSVPQTPLYNQYASEMAQAFDMVWLLRSSPQEALQAVQLRMQPRFERARRQWRRVAQERRAQWENL